MDDECNVLFVRGAEKSSTVNTADDVWDDTALINAYDKAVNLAKDVVAKRIGMEFECSKENAEPQGSKKSNQAQTSRKWTLGTPCRAIYSGDGQEYEAIITKMNEKSKTCQVTFVGYGNTETVELSMLCESNGLSSQIEQKKNSGMSGNEFLEHPEPSQSRRAAGQPNGHMAERMDYDNEVPSMSKNVFSAGPTFNSSYGTMPPAPPLPPQMMAKLPENDADALSSMLMSWYISGFHTGYYHGIKQARSSEEKRKK